MRLNVGGWGCVWIIQEILFIPFDLFLLDDFVCSTLRRSHPWNLQINLYLCILNWRNAQRMTVMRCARRFRRICKLLSPSMKLWATNNIQISTARRCNDYSFLKKSKIMSKYVQNSYNLVFFLNSVLQAFVIYVTWSISVITSHRARAF